MTRTKKSKPGGGTQPKKANTKNHNPKPKSKRVTRSQSKGQAEAGRPSKHSGRGTKPQIHDEEDGGDVVVMSDDVEPDQAATPATKRRKQDKPTNDQQNAQDGEGKDAALVSGIEMAFQQKRAVILGYRPEASNEEKELGKSILGDAKFREKLYHAIVDSPLMSSAWIAQSRPTGLKGWFIFCIFTTHQEAKLAVDGLNSALNPLGQPGSVFKASLRTWKTYPVIAQHIVPSKALAPRGSQGKVDKGGYPALTEYATALSELRQRIEFQASSKVPDGPAADAPGGKSVNTAPAHVAAVVQAPKHIKFSSPVVPTQPKVASVPPASQAAPVSRDSNIIVINAATLSELDYSEQVKYQCRYLGEVEKGVPIFGCILCLERDHLWNDCPERTCVHCGEKDTHVSRACLNVKKCSKCHEKGHSIEECPSKLRRTAEDGFHCDLCGEDTHSDDDCSYIWRAIIPERMPQLKKAPFLSVFCYNCGDQGHWGGDCGKVREQPKSFFDIFSAKEANKYIDSSAPIANLLGETIETARRYQSGGTGASSRGAGASQSQVDNYMAGYGQQPVQQPSKHHNISYPPNNSHIWFWHSDQRPESSSSSYAQLHTSQQLSYPLQGPAQIPAVNNYYQTYPYAHQSLLPARTTNRGTDGYVQYRGAHPLPPRPSQPSRQRSQSPPTRGYNSNRQRDEGYGAHSFSRGQGYYDDRGAYHYNPQYESRQPPPPPPDEDYGRRQTYHAVPPPPPEPSRGRQFGGRYSSHR